MHAQKQKTWVAVFLTGVVALAIAACGGAVTRQPAAGNGQLQVSLVDAPNPVVDEIWVNVTSVTAHSTASGWVTVSTFAQPFAVDLLKLQSATAPLGLVDLPPGTITQIRLQVSETGNHVVVGGQSIPLKVPSGCQSGIKIHGPWTVAACQRASVTLDFDGKKSIWTHPTGQGDEWILRPVIRTKKSASDDVGCGAPDAGTGETTPPPPPGGAGAACTSAVECLSGLCSGGTCSAGPAGAPCKAAADCASSACDAETGSCNPGTAGGVGSACSANTECLSNECVQNVCAPGGQGSPCTTNSDCDQASGLSCTNNGCQPPILAG
jgi:hypothetical protein